MSLRGHVVAAVFKRNFQSYFAGILGYLFIVLFVIVGAASAFGEAFFANGLASLDQLNAVYPLLMLFIIPAITMGVWAEEKKLGTQELLFTLPVSDLEVLVGKYLAVLAVYTVALLFSLTHAYVLQAIGRPDWGVLFTTYFGYWLIGVALLSMGMTASFLTSNTTVAFVLAALFCAIPVLLEQAPWPSFGPRLAAVRDVVLNYSIGRQFVPFGIGLAPIAGVFFFVSIAVFFLYVNLVLIGQRHWAGGAKAGEMTRHYLTRAICLGLAALGLNGAMSGWTGRIDATSERLFTLTKTTTELLGDLDAKRPVMIQAFVSKQAPRDYVQVKTTLLGLLGQYRQASRGNVSVRVVEVEPFSPEADQAKQFGIESRKIQSERGGRMLVDDVVLGAVISSGANEVVVPFFDVAIPAEYELTRSVRTVASDKKRVVGILETDAKLNGGFDMGSMRSNPEWRIVTELKKQYTVETVSAGSAIDQSKFDVLLAVLPSSLGEREMQNLVDYVKTGKPTLIFDDPVPAFNPSLAPRQPKPRPGGPMSQFGGGGPQEQKADGGRATSLVNLLDMQWNYDEVVYDYTFSKLHPEFEQLVRPEMVAISPAGGVSTAFSPKSRVTSGMQELLTFFAGSIRPRENSKLKFEPLLRTSKESGFVRWSDLVSNSFFGVELRDNPRRRSDPQAHVLAAHISTEGGDAASKLNVIYVADSDLISDWFFMVRERKMYDLELDNVTFVLNAVDELAGDSAYIDLRKRRPKKRSLDAVNQALKTSRERADQEREAAAEDAEQALTKAKEKLEEQVAKIEKDETLDQVSKEQLKRIEQENQQRKLDVLTAQIDQEKERKLERIKSTAQQEARAVESRFAYVATLLPPIPAILLGLLVWWTRSSNEQRDISAVRRR